MTSPKSRMLALFGKRDATEAPRQSTSTGLDLFLTGTPAATQPPKVAPVRPVSLPRPRLVFAVDATASRSAAWETAKQITDALFTALPGELDVALAVHGGSQVHTFTPFTVDAGALRDLASGVQCRPGYTCLLDILRRVLTLDRVRVVIYIGDVFEESEAEARKLADALKRKQTRVIILHDAGALPITPPSPFTEIADRTGGAVLPFDTTAGPRLRELLEAVAVLAVGGTELLAAKEATMPAARLLLEHLGGRPVLPPR